MAKAKTKTAPSSAKPGAPATEGASAPSPSSATSSTTASSTAASPTATSSSAPSPFPVLAAGAHTLASLHATLGNPDEEHRRLLLRNTHEQGQYESGVRAESANILSDVPRFVASALQILQSLDSDRRDLILAPPFLFGVLVSEAVTLETMLASHQNVAGDESDDKAKREATQKKVSGQGVALRNRVLGSLRSALGEARAAVVQQSANDASTPASLVGGLKAVATFLEKTLHEGAKDDIAALNAFGVGVERAKELRTAAAAISDATVATATTGKRVSQRALDIQDGRVLILMDMAYRAFRHGRRSDKSILLPELNRLTSLFATQGGSGGGTGGGSGGTPPDEGTSPKGGSPS